jgi:hypothetical protein
MDNILIERILQIDEEKVDKIFVSVVGNDYRSLYWQCQYWEENKRQSESIGICDFEIYKELVENEVIGKRLKDKIEFYVNINHFENIAINNSNEIKRTKRLYFFSTLKSLCFAIILIGFLSGITPFFLTTSFDFFTRWDNTWFLLLNAILSLIGFLLCLWLNKRYRISEKHQLLSDYNRHIIRNKKSYLSKWKVRNYNKKNEEFC